MSRSQGLTLAALLLFASPGPARGEEPLPQAATPAWLRAPWTRGPLAGVLAYDGGWAYGSLITGLPLGSRPHDDGASLARPAWSVNGSLAASGPLGTSGLDGRPRGAMVLDRS